VQSANRGAQSFAYQYDASGNRIDAGQVYDAANRLTQDAQFSYAYDGNGNLLSKQDRSTGARTLYRWTPWNQLRAVERYADATAATPIQTTSYTYDALKRRVSRSVNGVVETFVYDGQHRMATLNGSGALLERVTFGPRVDEPLAIAAGGTEQYLHADQLGSIIGVSSSTTLAGRYEYGPFGETIASATPTQGSPFRYTAREYESDDLYFYRARFYDPQQSRFLSQDPLGLAGGDTNLYRYAANNPVHIADPSGELAWFAIPIIWGAIEVGLSIYDAYDTASTIADPCTSAGEKWLAGGLFMAGVFLPGGGYSAADDIITSKPVKEGIYEFVDTTGKKYVGQSSDVPARLQQHVDSGKLDPGTHVDVNSMPGSTKTEREIAEHRRIQEITGGVPARQSDAVSNQRDPIGPRRQHLLDGP
jgi:RHS repeat-associated protein